ncbi:hypothetical protein [Alkalicoccobacillus porphyridii]|uniref:Uncharacterized protein n=1 Tax=Alkalicoccobacillus porphyridii TaxID=2597270 RepID=A0A554A090_9BACI|nr:hypothetical protein [Alkalicoccobacillus porphyridii]TSB47117.1 hypothetical protein FN960_08875 [Alkalicoccobacillus porphyridii]
MSWLKPTVSVLLIMVPSLAFGWQGNNTAMGLSIIASSLTVCFLHLDKLKSFKGGGVSVELQEAINEAYATIESVKKLAKPLLSHTVTNLSIGDVLVSTDAKIKKDYLDQVISVASELELNDLDFQNLIKGFFKVEAFKKLHDFHNWLRAELPEYSTEYDKDLLITEIGVFTDLTKLSNPQEITLPSEEDIITIINRYGQEGKLPPSTTEALNAYISFYNHHIR